VEEMVEVEEEEEEMGETGGESAVGCWKGELVGGVGSVSELGAVRWMASFGWVRRGGVWPLLRLARPRGALEGGLGQAPTMLLVTGSGRSPQCRISEGTVSVSDSLSLSWLPPSVAVAKVAELETESMLLLRR